MPAWATKPAVRVRLAVRARHRPVSAPASRAIMRALTTMLSTTAAPANTHATRPAKPPRLSVQLPVKTNSGIERTPARAGQSRARQSLRPSVWRHDSSEHSAMPRSTTTPSGCANILNVCGPTERPLLVTNVCDPHQRPLLVASGTTTVANRMAPANSERATLVR